MKPPGRIFGVLFLNAGLTLSRYKSGGSAHQFDGHLRCGNPCSTHSLGLRLKALEAILKTFKAKTQQEAIYLEIEHDVDVRFL